MLEIKNARKNSVDRITEQELKNGERVLVFRGALSKGNTTIGLKSLKLYGDWKKNKKILLDMIKEVDSIEITNDEIKKIKNISKRLEEIRVRQEEISNILWPPKQK